MVVPLTTFASPRERRLFFEKKKMPSRKRSHANKDQIRYYDLYRYLCTHDFLGRDFTSVELAKIHKRTSQAMNNHLMEMVVMDWVTLRKEPKWPRGIMNLYRMVELPMDKKSVEARIAVAMSRPGTLNVFNEKQYRDPEHAEWLRMVYERKQARQQRERLVRSGVL